MGLTSLLYGFFLLTNCLATTPDEAAAKARAEREARRRTTIHDVRFLNGWILPKQTPSAERRERFVLLLPEGPIIVELRITLDGKPYWTYREALIAELLQGDAKVNAGRVSWRSILKDPRAPNDRFDSYDVVPRLAEFDLDGDGFADREELQIFLARAFQGGSLKWLTYGWRQPQIPLARLLDSDADGKLSAAEIDAAPARLAARDTDGNELLHAAELGEPLRGQSITLLHSIDDGFDPKNVLTRFVSRYAKDKKLRADAFSGVPGFFAALDADANGELKADELQALEKIPAHLVLEVNLGRPGSLLAGVVVRHVSPLLNGKTPAGAGEQVTIEMPKLKLQILGVSPPPFNHLALLTRLDIDKNGYLEMRELERQPTFATQFMKWDANGDGKVYADELKTFYDRFQTPELHSASIGAVELINPLWDAIDSNGDGQISVRERLEANAKLQSLDVDRDGQVASEETPPTVRIVIARGHDARQYLDGFRRSVQPSGPLPGPAWFHNMDRNSDGDVTRREFLGSEDQFRSLDANSDGILEIKEVSPTGP